MNENLRTLATGSELGTIRTLATAMGFKFFLLLSVSKIGGVQTGCQGRSLLERLLPALSVLRGCDGCSLLERSI